MKTEISEHEKMRIQITIALLVFLFTIHITYLASNEKAFAIVIIGNIESDQVRIYLLSSIIFLFTSLFFESIRIVIGDTTKAHIDKISSVFFFIGVIFSSFVLTPLIIDLLLPSFYGSP